MYSADSWLIGSGTACTAQHRGSGSAPAEDADVASQVLNEVVHAPVLILDALVVVEKGLACHDLGLVLAAYNVQPHVIHFDLLVLLTQQHQLVALPCQLQQHTRGLVELQV